MEEHIIHHGFIAPIINADHFVLGASQLPTDIIRADRDYTSFLPEFERQMLYGLETCNCSGFGTDQAIQIYLKAKYGVTMNFSDRDLGIKAGTRPPGNDPHTVAEAWRKQGVAQEKTLPWTTDANTIDKYYSYPSEQKKNQCITEGKNFLTVYDMGHEWVWSDPNISIAEKQKLILDALQYSPVAVSVLAWRQDGDVYVKDRGEPDNHWVVIVKGEEGKPWKILDHYSPFLKDLEWEYDFGFAKRYHLEKVSEEEVIKQSAITALQEQIIALANQVIALYQKLIAQKFGSISVQNLLQSPLQILLQKLTLSLTNLKYTIMPKETYLWDTPAHARHSVRVLCDEASMSVAQKNILCACVQQESQFNPKAIGKPNTNGTIDYGICQFNNGKNAEGVPLWIGPGADFASVDEVLNNPEKCVRVMIREFKAGHQNWWSSYKTGAYKKWL